MKGQHGGDITRLARETGRTPEELLDFSANINPIGPPPWLSGLINDLIPSLVHYPDPHCTSLVKAIAESRNVPVEEIVVGNGSSELLHLLPRVLGARRALIPVPAYSDYARAASLAGLKVEALHLKEEDDFVLSLPELERNLKDGDAVFIGQPANPTGYICDPEELRALAKRHGKIKFIIDEAFADFIEGVDSLQIRRPKNLIVLGSMTKFFAIPGLRLGYAVSDRKTAEGLRDIIPTWSVNTLAQAVGERAIGDSGYAAETRRTVSALRERLSGLLMKMPGLKVYPGKANFLLLRTDREGLNAQKIAESLIAHGIAIRTCDNIDGLDKRFFRIAVRREEENLRLCAALADIFDPACKNKSEAAKASHSPSQVSLSGARPKPAVMFQGTCSHAGKSVLTAALCRILLQDGYRVAPFKAQNMSLNSFVTPDGGEIGRAQALQAQACRIEPDVRMNPLLLKPATENGSQVIIMGKPVGNMDFVEYTRRHEECLETARRAYDSLAAEYDVLVLEGAGSPAEVNLLNHDIANMKTARHARAPVLLVGNIDRGGVYASFMGTMEILPPADRSLIAGFVVNRFRGTASLLADAHEYILRRTGRPVLGVVPELFDLGLPEEDSVGFRKRAYGEEGKNGASVEIAVIAFRHISNFTDLDPLRIEPDVRLKIVHSPQDLNSPDAVILPGSKNVAADLAFLSESGLKEKLLSLYHNGKTEIIGICGGLQILGRDIADPHGIESAGGKIAGLGILPIRTVLAPDKLLVRTEATHLPSGHFVRGYEIHHGRTEGMEALPLMKRPDGEAVGASLDGGKAWGTYLHGVFDADEFRRWFIDDLRIKRGLMPLRRVSAYDLEPALDRLASSVRESLDMEGIYKVMGLR